MKRTTALFIACALLLCGCSKAEDTPEYITTPAETSSETAPVPSEAEESPYKSYAFDHLTETEQQIYTAIADAAKNYEEKAVFPEPVSWEICRKAYIAVFRMETDIFWLSSLLRPTDPEQMVSELYLHYDFTKEECKKMSEEIENAAADVLKKAETLTSDYEKLKLFHDFLVLRADFSDESDYTTGTIYGGLVGKSLRCGGYAKTIRWLCQRAGIENTIADGESNGISHTWNKVKCGGRWYNLDATWDDPVIKSSSIRRDTYIRYDYFLVPDSDIIGLTHTLSEEIIKSPECNSTSENYFNKEHLCAYSAESGIEMLKEASIRSVKSGIANAEVRFASKEEYDITVKKLFDSGGITPVLKSANAAAGGNVISETAYARSLNSDLLIINVSFSYKSIG